MRAEAGARMDAPFFLVLLTDGKSQDDAIAAANRLKNAGVEIIAVGEKERGWCSNELPLLFEVSYFALSIISIQHREQFSFVFLASGTRCDKLQRAVVLLVLHNALPVLSAAQRHLALNAFLLVTPCDRQE